MELRLSSPQRFDLRIHDAGGVRSVRLAPVPGAWIRSAVPLSFFTQAARSGNDLASVHNKARPMMFINLSGTPGELKSVTRDRRRDGEPDWRAVARNPLACSWPIRIPETRCSKPNRW